MTSRVEIWSLAGPYWRLPVRVVWFQELGEVRTGGGSRLPHKMIAVADECLASISTSRNGTSFWVRREDLEKHARKFHGDDPDDVIEWLPSKMEKAPVREDFVADDFITGYCSSPYAVVRDTLMADRIWVSIRKFMLHWLLNEYRTVDLLFAELDALCLRKNWASAAARKELRDRFKMEKGDYLNPDKESMVRRGITEFFVNPEITAWDPDSKRMRWTLECTTNREWERMVSKCERNKKSVHRGGRYRMHVWRRMLAQIRRVMEIYGRYLEETSKPYTGMVEVREIRNRGVSKFPVGRFSTHTPDAPCDEFDPVHAALEPDPEGPVVSPDATLHDEMPDL